MSDQVGPGPDGKLRCWWCLGDDKYLAYHDDEWGVPIRDDEKLFGLLMLEGFQAGLSWRTILYKRENFDRAFDGWDPNLIAEYTPAKIDDLLTDTGIIRNRLKCEGAVRNAQAFLRIQEDLGSFSDYVWSFVGGETLPRAVEESGHIPASTPISDALSKDLKKRGFTFVGSTIVYAFMQSAGLVNDHDPRCYKVAPP